MNQKFWLFKSEPSAYSIDDLARDKMTRWEGVRNYQARNFMRDSMQPGDLFLFYRSNTELTGIAGIGKILNPHLPDKTALDKKSDYFDPKATPEENVWLAPEVAFVEKFPRFIPLEELKKNPKLENMVVIKKGMRLSIQPVTKEEFEEIKKRA